MKIRDIILAGLMMTVTTVATAQEKSVTATDGWTLDVEMQGSLSNSKTPLWLNANKYGISSLNAQNGYVRGIGAWDKKLANDKLDVNAGLDVIVPVGYKSQGGKEHYTSHLVLQQAFVEANYKLGQLTIGAKHQPMELKNNELSSGAQALGINARPVPQVRIGLNDYWSVPGTKKWVSVKAHMAYGVMTDGGWEEAFASSSHYAYNKNTRYHQKAGYLKIGNEEKFPLTLTVGLEMAAQFGGKLYKYNSSTKSYTETKVRSNFNSYWHAFTGTGAEEKEEGTEWQNAEGNHLGSWVARLNWKAKDWEVGLYMDHYFEDHSSMLLLDYDGYGHGDEWNKKVDSRYFRYDLKDGLWGVDMKLRRFRYLNQAVVEYMTTRYQSGPIYHDHTKGISDHICGKDGYYNHGIMPGWQHFGQFIGNPLYLSPIYNTDGYIGPRCNRFKAWHFGIAGDPAEGLHYRALLSWQKGWGTYSAPYYYPKENTSLLIEAAYRFPATSMLRGFTATIGYGADWGELRGNNSGVQMTVLYKVR
ncbi:MAG: hypothetical protein IJ782_00195 [Prevotella sp.]|nr:hypothetical protein [Prevotella sp.]